MSTVYDVILPTSDSRPAGGCSEELTRHIHGVENLSQYRRSSCVNHPPPTLGPSFQNESLPKPHIAKLEYFSIVE